METNGEDKMSKLDKPENIEKSPNVSEDEEFIIEKVIVKNRPQFIFTYKVKYQEYPKEQLKNFINPENGKIRTNLIKHFQVLEKGEVNINKTIFEIEKKFGALEKVYYPDMANSPLVVGVNEFFIQVEYGDNWIPKSFAGRMNRSLRKRELLQSLANKQKRLGSKMKDLF